MQTQVETPETTIQELQVQQSSLFRWIGELKVSTDAEQKNAEDLLIAARAALKLADEKRKELTRPLDETQSKIIALFKPYRDRITHGIDLINAALTKYHNKKLIDAEAARLTALAQEACRIAEARDTGEILEPLSQPVQPIVAKTSRTNLGSVTYNPDYDIQVVDPDLVPRDLCEPSMTKIRARVKSGVLNIPGVLISRKFVTAARISGGRLVRTGGNGDES